MHLSRGARIGLVLAVLISVFIPMSSAQAETTFGTGDVFVGAGGNQVQWRAPDGTLVMNMTTAVSSPNTTGMALDSAKKLHVTGYTSNIVNTFNPDGTAGPLFTSNSFSHPESIVFDAAGNAYVGQQSGNRDILKFGPAGNLLGAFNANREANKGTDRIDLAADQCTIVYTSQGKAVKRFNACTNTQLSDLTTTLPGSVAYDVRILPGGGVIVADSDAIRRLDDAGAIVQTYDALAQDCWLGLALDSDPSSFWAADACTQTLHKFGFGSSVPVLSVATLAASAAGIGGLAVAGGITAARVADLNVTQADNPDPVTGSNTVQYLVNVANGGSISSGNVTLTETMSAGQITSISGPGWSCSGSGTSGTCTRGPIPAGASVDPVEVLVKAPNVSVQGSITSTATASSTATEPTPADNTSSEQTTVNPATQGTGTGFCSKAQGCTVSTGTTTSVQDPTVGQVIFPPIAGASGGEVYTFTEELGAFCGAVQCTGNVLNLFNFINDPGYNPNNPIRVILIHDASIAPGVTATSTVWKESTPAGELITTCEVAGIAFPSPCVDDQFRQADGSLRVEILFVPGDPRVGNLCFPC